MLQTVIEDGKTNSSGTATGFFHNYRLQLARIPDRPGRDKLYPKSMNILMLGEIGVGKSTFINAFINNLKFSSLKEAIDSEVEVLIESEFTLTDDNYEEKVIKVKPTHSGKEDNTNEVLTPGQSSTQHPRAYVFEYTHNDEVKEIRIIDTPGIGDTRGDKYDRENFGNILKFIAEYSEIHAICILMKPNDSRETLVFKYCIDELLTHLHKNASRNILFCFTNSRGTCYRPGDTLTTLKTHLAKLHTSREISIPVNRNTMFCFDSESFRFLCATKQGFVFTDKQKEDYRICWKTSVEETVRLFDRICEIPVHNTQETLCLNSTRSLILALSDPLAKIVQVNVRNQEYLQQTIQQVRELASNDMLLARDLIKKQWILKMEKIPYPKTVCTSESCIEFSRIGSGTELKTVYKTVCHADCYLDGVQIPRLTVEEAKEWFNEIRKELINEEYECITENTVKKSIGIMKKFENNEKIVVKGIDILERMTRRSDITVLYIRNTPGAIENIMKLFKNNDYRNSDFFFILIRIVECKETQKHLMKSEYLSLIFEQLSNKQNTYYILLSSQILACLLDFSKHYFPVNLTKNMIENKIIERIPLVFPSLRVFDSPALPRDYSWCLERLTNGTKAQKYVCATVVVCASEYSGRQLIHAGAILILERVSSDANTDSFVKETVDQALQNLKKENPL